MQSKETRRTVAIRTVLGLVLHRNEARWRRFNLAILKNEADAEDVIQEGVRRVLARNVVFHSEDDVRKYLGKAIGNAAFELYNARKRERRKHIVFYRRIPGPARNPNSYTVIEDQDRFNERARLLRLLREGLNRLPSKQYEALRLTMLESCGLSIRNIGAANGIPYSTLRHRTKQGLRRLRKFFESSDRHARSRLRLIMFDD